MPIIEKEATVKVDPWYLRVHLGERLLSICLFLVTLKETGGHLPTTTEGWVFLVALCASQVWGVSNSINGATTAATPKP